MRLQKPVSNTAHRDDGMWAEDVGQRVEETQAYFRLGRRWLSVLGVVARKPRVEWKGVPESRDGFLSCKLIPDFGCRYLGLIAGDFDHRPQGDKKSGASFALNAMIEADRVTELGRSPELIDTPSESGSGQLIARCPRCKVAVWSNYAGAGPVVRFVRVGTLDNPDFLPPDIHIFTASKQPWVVLPDGIPAVAEYYDRERYWPPESLARRRAIVPLIEAYQAAQRGSA